MWGIIALTCVWSGVVCNVRSRTLGSRGSPRGHFPIDLDEICQNIVALDPADAFSGGPKRRLFGGMLPVAAGPEPILRLSLGKYSFFQGNRLTSLPGAFSHRF